MFEPQNVMDLPENSGFGDLRSWLPGDSGDADGGSSGAGRNLDRVLFNDLVEIVPLVQSLIDRKASSSYTRRGSMAYTRTPSRESLSGRVLESKGRNAAQAMPSRKKRDHGDRDQGKNGSNDNQDGDRFASISSRDPVTEKEEELLLLRGQLDELQRRLSDKDDLLKSMEITQAKLQAQIDELQHESAEKDSLIKSFQLQLSDAKIKLADKQAALEKTQWEALASGKRVEKLQQELSSMQGEVSSIVSLFEGLKETNATANCEDYDFAPNYLDGSSFTQKQDDLDMSEMHRMEEARLAYIAALAMAKARQDEESMASAAKGIFLNFHMNQTSERKQEQIILFMFGIQGSENEYNDSGSSFRLGMASKPGCQSNAILICN